MEQRFGLDIDKCKNDRSICRIVLGRTCLRADPALVGEFDESCGAPEVWLPVPEEVQAPASPEVPNQPVWLEQQITRLETWLAGIARRILREES